MKWYVIPPLITCGLNSMLAAITLCLAVFHLLTDKSTNAPIQPNEEWISLVKWLSVFSAFWLILSVAGMYLCMSRRQTWRATAILLLYVLCFGISVYFNVSFSNQMDMKEVGSDILFKTTVEEITNNRGDAWIPGWLDNIQKQSKVCCGIMTYRDYEEFWPSTSSRIPRSCCKEIKTTPSSCPSDLNLIPFPNTPSDFVKVEMGCMQEILEALRQHIRESYQNSVMMTVFIACGILAYLVLYTKRYLEGVEDAASQQQKDNGRGGGDGRDFEIPNGNQNPNLNSGSGPLIISSSGQMGSIDSFEGIPAFGSIDSFPVQGQGGFPDRQYISDQAPLQYRQQQLSPQMQQQPNLQQYKGQQSSQVPLPILQQQQAFQAMQMQQLPQQWQTPQQTQQLQQPSGPLSNKGNIDGIQQQILLQQQQDQQLQQQRLNQQLQKQHQEQQLQQQRQNQQLQKQHQNQNQQFQLRNQKDQQFQLQNQKDQFQLQNLKDQQFQLQNQKDQLQLQNQRDQLQLQNQKDQFQLQNQKDQFQLQNRKDQQQFQLQNQKEQLQFQQQKPIQQQPLQFQQQKLPQQQQLQPPQFIDTSMDDNLGTIEDGVSAPQREDYVPISGAGKSTDREQSNQMTNMGRNFMQPLLPMGNPDIIGIDDNIARMEQQQQTQDAPVISPPGSPTGRRKKVRKEALANRNNK